MTTNCQDSLVEASEESKGRLAFLLAAGLTFFLAAFCWVSSLHAENRELKTDAPETVDAVLVLDASGSMLLNDPLRLRYEGARLFLQFLKPGDRLGIVNFAETAAIARPLSAYDGSQSESVAALLAQIQATGEYTDIYSGLRVATEMLHADAHASAKPLIVLLSDGRMDPPSANGSAEQLTDKLMNELLPDLKAQGMRVYTLAFSEEADKALLSQIAASTDGVQWFTPTADKVHESFADLFLAVKKPQVLPLSAKGFVIDGDVQEATFYVNRDGDADVYLKAPSGAEIRSTTQNSAIKWFRGQKFDVVTIIKPEIGSWQIFGISPNEGFATILTNLKLVSDWPPHIEAGSDVLLQARLYEDKKPISLPEMTGASRFAFQITPTDKVAEPIIREFLVDDGTKGDKIAGDGIFSFQVKLDDPGEYRLRILAKAPTFERQQQIPFRVKPPIITIAIESGHEEAAHESSGHDSHGAEEQKAGEGEGGEQSHHDDEAAHDESKHMPKEGPEEGDEKSRIVIRLSDEVLALRNIQVKLTAVDANRERYTVVAKKGHDPLEYEVSAAVLPADGLFTLQATMVAEEKQKKTRKEESSIVKFNRTSTGEAPAAVMVQVVEEKKEQGFPLVELLIVTIANIGSVGFVFVLFKRVRGKTSNAAPLPPIPDAVFQGISALEQKMAFTEIDLLDPIFSDRISAPGQATSGGGGASEAPKAETPLEEIEKLEEAPSESAPDDSTTHSSDDQEEGNP